MSDVVGPLIGLAGVAVGYAISIGERRRADRRADKIRTEDRNHAYEQWQRDRKLALLTDALSFVSHTRIEEIGHEFGHRAGTLISTLAVFCDPTTVERFQTVFDVLSVPLDTDAVVATALGKTPTEFAYEGYAAGQRWLPLAARAELGFDLSDAETAALVQFDRHLMLLRVGLNAISEQASIQYDL